MRYLTVLLVVFCLAAVASAQQASPNPPGYGYHYIPDGRGYMIGRDYAGFFTNLGPLERSIDLGVVRLEWADGAPYLECTCFIVKVIRHCDLLDDQATVSGIAYPQNHLEKSQKLIMGRRRPGSWEGMFFPHQLGEWEIALRIKRCQKPDEIVYFQMTVQPLPYKGWICPWLEHDCPGSCPD